MTSSPRSRAGGCTGTRRGWESSSPSAPAARPTQAIRRRSSAPCSPPRTSPRSAGPSSSTTRWWARARRGARRTADAAVLMLPESDRAIAVAIDGNGRRVACDPYAGDGRGGAGVRAEPGLRRRRAARPDQLPQLRQPGEAQRRLAARPGRSGPGGCLPRAADPGGRRQRLALQRDRARADLPDAGRRHGRRAAGSGTGSGIAPARATGWCWSGRSRPRWQARSWRSSAASSTRACRRCRSAPLTRPSASSGRRCATASPPRHTTSATVGSPALWPRWRSRPGTGIEVDLDPLVELRGGSGESCLFGEGPGGIVLAVDGDRLDELLAAAETAGVEAVEIGSVDGRSHLALGRRARRLGGARRRRAGLALAAGPTLKTHE